MSYLTCIFSDSPGSIGLLGFFGIVHPHVDFTFVIIRGELPSFVNSKSLIPFEPFSITP